MADRDRNFERSSDDLNRVESKSARAADKALGRHDEPATTGDVVGEAVGGVSGIAAGAALGSHAGPVGTVIGAIAGAVGGWWAGRAVSEAATTYTDDDDAYYRRHFETRRASGLDATTDTDYDAYRPAYQLGQVASRNPDYADRNFDDIETDLRRGWTDDVSQRYGAWDKVRDRARAGFERGREQRLTLSEEQLDIGKRQVNAGEAAIRKTVDTEHVKKTVPVQREEVTVERRPISAGSARDVDIGEDEIRVPLSAEEVVVEKRAVPTEELVIKKRLVTEEKQIEADLRKERVDDSSLRNATTRPADTAAGAAAYEADRAGNAVERGARKTANKLDDLKDRVDGNPASKPGPDPTDNPNRL